MVQGNIGNIDRRSKTISFENENILFQATRNRVWSPWTIEYSKQGTAKKNSLVKQ